MAIEEFREFDKKFRKTYDTLGLKYLLEHTFNNENSGQYICHIDKKEKLHPYPFSIFKIHDELNFITMDIKYVTGMLFLLRPHINNTYHDFGYYYQTNEDHRYLMFANFGLQSVYNFWDRLGDLIYLFFETGLKHDQIFFGRVMNNIKPKWKQTKSYTDLKELYDQEVRSFLDVRHEAVHHFQLECKFYWSNIEFQNDLDKIKEINNEKYSYADKMSDSLNNCAKAFKLAIDFICELPDKDKVVANKSIA